MKTLHTIFTNFAKRSAMLLTLLLAVGIGQAWGAEATYTKVTSAPADWSGEYIVVYESNNIAHVWTGVDAAKCNTTANISSNSVTGDFVTVTIAPMTDGYSIKVNGGTNSGKYIYGTSGSNKLNFGTDAQLNTLSYEADGVKITSNTSVLTFNDNSNEMRFRYYKSASYGSMKKVQLYKISTGGGGDSEPCDNPTVSWSTEPADGEVGGSMTASVTTNYSDGLTYSSSNQDVATISDEGVIYYLAAGTAIITATVTGDGTTICEGPESVEQEITVTAAGGSGGESGDCTWEETDISAISSTDIVIITMTNSDGTYAMSNNNGTSSAPSAVNVTITDGKLSTEENIKWNVGGTTNAYVFYPEGSDNNLYCTSTNNGVRVGTNAANTFKIDTESGYLVHNGTSRYIGVYNSQDWRCYTSINANITNQTLKFYKQVCPVVEYTVTYKANGGTGNDVETTTSKVADCTFARNGYNFTGWNTEADGSGDSYDVDSEVTSDLILYAQWEIINYSITYYLNDGTNNNANPETYTIETETITLQNPSRNGYTFGGWYEQSDFSGSAVTEITKGSTGHKTLYAQWTAIKYTITYNDTKGATNTNPITYTIEDEITFTALTNLPKGYNFTGWNPVSIAKGTTGNQTITAQWTEKPLTRYRTDCDACIPLDGDAKINGTYHFFPGETITLTVTPPADDVPYTYQWQKFVEDEWEDIDGKTTTTYTKAEATIEDVGHYRCVVSAEGYCDAFAEYDVKCLQLNVYYNDHSFAFTTPLEKVDATTASISVNLQNAKYQYYFEITDGCENFYGFNGDIHSGWYENVELNAMNSFTHCGLQTTKFGTYIFTVDHSYLTDDNKLYPVVTVTYPASLQEADKVIYLDNNVLKWTHSNNADGTNKIYYRIGREDHNSKIAMTLVPGTANLYKVTTSEYNNFAVWHIANNGCGSGDNPIYRTKTGDDWAATQATAFETLPVTLESVTVTPTTSIGNGGEDRNSNCEFYNYNITEGMKTWNAKIVEPTNGTITVSYTHHDGTAVNDFTSSDRDLAHTCLLTITATPNTGYKLGTLTVNDVPFTSGDVHTLTEDAVIKATWTEKETPTFAWSAATCTAALEADNTFPTLNNTNNLPVTYSSSKPDIAKIDENGDVILGAVGETEITATGAETATHKSATTTYKLTVVASNCRWVEVEIGDITYGDDVLITVPGTDGYGNPILNMLQDPQASTNPTIETMNVSDLLNGANVDATLIWNIRKRDDNQDNFTIYRNGSTTDRLVFVSGNDIRVGSSTSGSVDSIFTITTEGYLQCIQTLHNMRMSGSSDWRHYTTAGQTLKFYKRECLDPTEVWVEGNLTNVSCTPQLPQQLAKDGTITLIFKAVDGYALPTSVSVEMGSTPLAPLWNRTTGELTINAPTGGFTDNVLVTVEALQVKTVTFSVDSEDTAPIEMQAEENTDIILPAFTTNLTCVKFVGWTDADNDAAITSSNIYKAGDTYTVTQDITLKAVYAAGGGFVLVTDANDLAAGDHIVIAAAGFDVAMGADRGSNRGEVEVTKDNDDNTITTPDGIQILTLEAGTTAGTLAFNTGNGYLYAAGGTSSNHLKTTQTLDNKGSWNISINAEGIATIKSVEPTGGNARNWLRYNSTNNPPIFSCYASGQADVSIYKESITGYTTDPECVMYNVTLCTPTNGTISVDKTIVDPYGSTILTFAPAAGYMLDVVTITSGTAEVGTVSYTSNQTSDGTVKISNIQSDIEVCATFKAIPYYKVTFVDMNNGNAETIVHQSEFGGDITAPATASDGCDVTWTFMGWAPSNSLNGTTEVPANLVEAGGTISGANITSNLVYYSVYSNSSDGTPPFSIGKSGTYHMYALDGTTKYYATTNRYGNALNAGEEESNDFNIYPKAKVKLTYNSNTNKYKIQITTFGNNPTDGYLYHPDATEQDITHNSLENYTEFTLQNGSASGYNIVYNYTVQQLQGNVYVPVVKTGCFGKSNAYFNASTTITDVYFEPASEMRYYNASSCTELVTMSFHNPFGSSKAQLQYEVGYEEDYYTNTSKKSVNVFPTLEYAGWTFIGWTAGSSYNAAIGDENLNDENSSASAPTQDIYKTGGGLSYYLGSDVTMYPVFTKFEDNEPFDMVNGGDYYIYYIADADITTSVDEYGAAQRIYATGWTGEGSASYSSTQNCDNATLFTFTKLENGKWTIYDNTFGDFLYARGNDISHREEEIDGTKNIKEWAITIFDGNQFEAIAVEGNALSANSTDAISGTFKNYATSNFNNNSKYYHRVYLGTCTERVYSSNPTNKPTITLNGEPIVTSTQDQSIRAQGELSISATKLAANGTITLTSDNADVYFSTVKDANFTQATKPVTPLTLKADEKGKLATTTVYVHYKPTSTSSLGVQTANITATTGTEGEEDYATAETTAHVRNLPANFVIATKVGAIWYALPADLTTASNPLGVVIEVDETNMTATAPNSCTYTLFPVKTTNTEYDRYEEYGDRLRFSAVNNSYKGLWANNSKTDLTINNDMVIDQASDGQTGSDLANNSYYEWKVTTTVVDGHWQYTLQTDQTQNQNYLRYWTSAEGTPVGPKWGTYNAGENRLYFLPVTETQPFEYDVVEWYPTKMLIQTDAAITSPTVKVGGEEIASPELTSKGGKLYEISNLPLETNPNEVLQVSFTADAVNYVNAKVVPIILSREAKSITGEPFATLTQKVYQYADIVVRDGATLTIDGGTDVANTLLGMTIYPTAKVAVAEGYKLSVHNLTFFGGIDEIYDGSAYTINKYGVPQLSLKGTLGKTITNIDYIMRVNLDQMYQVGVPYDVNLSDITYWDGTTMTLGDNLYVSAYDGQKRANREEKSWVWETDFAEKLGSATLKPGIGYTISADKQDADHEYSIIRMPMKNNIMSGNTETAKTVQVYAYDNKNGVEITDNHKGWNYLSNPYMVAISGAEADSKLVVGYLRETGTGPWEWVDDTYRYVTIPSDDGKWYDQQKFEEATLLPFKSFFLQIATSGELSFALASRQNAPARYLQSSNEQHEVEFEVLLANDTRSDNLGFLIGEDYTPAYEINADLEKMIGSMSVYTIYNGYNLAYNALSPTNAAEQIPIGYVVPTVGEYTFALDESSDIEDVEHIYLIDHETSAITDLVTDVYTFTTLEQKSDTRFAINVALKSKDNTATGLDNMNTNGELPTKFIYQDKMYILHHGVIYDTTGKRVITINK